MHVTQKCVDLYHCLLGRLPYKVSRNPCDRTYSPHGVVFLRYSVCANGIAPLPADIVITLCTRILSRSGSTEPQLCYDDAFTHIESLIFLYKTFYMRQKCHLI